MGPQITFTASILICLFVSLGNRYVIVRITKCCSNKSLISLQYQNGGSKTILCFHFQHCRNKSVFFLHWGKNHTKSQHWNRYNDSFSCQWPRGYFYQYFWLVSALAKAGKSPRKQPIYLHRLGQCFILKIKTDITWRASMFV